MYVHEIGRAGRDDQLSYVNLFWKPCDQQNTSKVMMEYFRNISECRRQLQFQDFEDANLITPPPTKCQCCECCLCSSILSYFIVFT